MNFISLQARCASQELAEERGTFPNYPESIWKDKNFPSQCHSYLYCPHRKYKFDCFCIQWYRALFALAFRRYVLDNTELLEVNPLLKKIEKLSNSGRNLEGNLEKGNLEELMFRRSFTVSLLLL